VPRRSPRIPSHEAASRLPWAELGRDRVHGATDLYSRLLAALADALAALPDAGAPPFRGWARSIEGAQPAMAGFRRVAAELRAPGVGAVRLRAWVQRERRALAKEPARLIAVAAREFPPAARVLTISRSETVLRLLTSLGPGRRPARVLVLESEPGGEGRRTAEELRAAGLPVTLVPDADGTAAVAMSDLVLLGADAIYADGSVVNKVGSLAIARAARAAAVPVIVAAGASKIIPTPVPGRPLPPLFELVPARLIAAHWTGARVNPGKDPATRRPATRSRSGRIARSTATTRAPRRGA
jgi:hypothetical protein